MNANTALTELMVKAARIEKNVAQLRGAGESGNGRIRVEVDATGKITDLHVDETMLGKAGYPMARLITAAQHAACANVRAAADGLERELRDDPYAAAVVSQAAAASLASEAPQPPRAQPKVAEWEDDDFGTPERWLH